MEGNVWTVVFIYGIVAIVIPGQASTNERGCVKLNGTVEYDSALRSSNPFGIVKASEVIDILVPRLNNHLSYDCLSLHVNYTDIVIHTSESYIKFTTTFKVTSSHISDNENEIYNCLGTSTVFLNCEINPSTCFPPINGHSATHFSKDTTRILPCCRETGCPKDYCASNPCANGAICVDTWDDFYCFCTFGWEGKKCNETATIPQVTVTPLEVTVTEGNNTTFTCTATGSPAPTIKWFLVSTSLTPVTNLERHAVTNGILNIRNIVESDSGSKYRCYAFNKNGNSSQTATIKNVYALPIVSVTPHLLNATEGFKAVFFCHVTGNPIPKISWFKIVGKDYHDISKIKRYVVGKRTLTILNITKKDMGVTFVCIAKNKVGYVKDIGKLQYVYDKNRCSSNRCSKGYVCKTLPDGGYECSPPENKKESLCRVEPQSHLYLAIGFLICVIVVQFVIFFGRYIYSRRISPRNHSNGAPQAHCSTVVFSRVPSRGQVPDQVDGNMRIYTELRPTSPPPSYTSLRPSCFVTGAENEGFYSEINPTNQVPHTTDNSNRNFGQRHTPNEQLGERQVLQSSLQLLPYSASDAINHPSVVPEIGGVQGQFQTPPYTSAESKK